MPKYKITNNPLSINGAVRQRGDIVELDEVKVKAYGADLEAVADEQTAGEGEDATDYKKLKKEELEKIAEERGLDYEELNKGELVALLKENDEQTAGEGEGDDEGDNEE